MIPSTAANLQQHDWDLDLAQPKSRPQDQYSRKPILKNNILKTCCDRTFRELHINKWPQITINRIKGVKKSTPKLHNDVRHWLSHTENDYFVLLLVKWFAGKQLNDVVHLVFHMTVCNIWYCSVSNIEPKLMQLICNKNANQAKHVKISVHYCCWCLPCSLNSLSAMYIAELPQTEPVTSWGVHIAVYSHYGARGGHFKCLPNLNIHLKVGNGTPVVRSWNRG